MGPVEEAVKFTKEKMRKWGGACQGILSIHAGCGTCIWIGSGRSQPGI